MNGDVLSIGSSHEAAGIFATSLMHPSRLRPLPF